MKCLLVLSGRVDFVSVHLKLILGLLKIFNPFTLLLESRITFCVDFPQSLSRSRFRLSMFFQDFCIILFPKSLDTIVEQYAQTNEEAHHVSHDAIEQDTQASSTSNPKGDFIDICDESGNNLLHSEDEAEITTSPPPSNPPETTTSPPPSHPPTNKKSSPSP